MRASQGYLHSHDMGCAGLYHTGLEGRHVGLPEITALHLGVEPAAVDRGRSALDAVHREVLRAEQARVQLRATPCMGRGQGGGGGLREGGGVC